MWKCSNCDRKFKTEYELRKHQNEKGLCPFCCSDKIIDKQDGSETKPFCDSCKSFI